MIIRLLFILLAVTATNCYSTEQMPEIFYSEGVAYEMDVLPLSSRPGAESINISQSPIARCTANHRGYVGEWYVANGYLWLQNLSAGVCDNNPRRIDPKPIFYQKNYPIKATWYTGIIRIKMDEATFAPPNLLDRNARHLGSSRYAAEYEFVKGRMIIRNDLSRGHSQSLVQEDLETHLKSLTVKDTRVEFSFIKSFFVKIGNVEERLTTFTLQLDESFSRRDRHDNLDFILQEIDTEGVQLGYTHHYRFPLGSGMGTDTGVVRLSFDQSLSRFRESWRSCSTTTRCVVIPTSCNGYISVSSKKRDVAELHFQKLAAIKQCLGESTMAPVPSCVDGRCRP